MYCTGVEMRVYVILFIHEWSPNSLETLLEAQDKLRRVMSEICKSYGSIHCI